MSNIQHNNTPYHITLGHHDWVALDKGEQVIVGTPHGKVVIAYDERFLRLKKAAGEAHADGNDRAANFFINAWGRHPQAGERLDYKPKDWK